MKTPLHNENHRLGARMTEFAGWEMPLYYTGIIREVKTTRNCVGIFDLSHMGELIVSGKDALELIQYVTTNDASRLGVGQAQYTLLLNQDGGIIDDLIVYRLREQTYMLVVNASNTKSDFEWISRFARHDVDCENRSHDIALIAVQGPLAIKVIQPIAESDISALSRFDIRNDRVGGVQSWVARTGYTGEDGFEIYCPAEESENLWRAVMGSGEQFEAEPVGLGARDVLRLEAGYPLYGNELSADVNPFESRLMWAVKPEKGNFIGRDEIVKRMKDPPEKLLAGLESVERCVPRHEYDVMSDGNIVGHVTSGTFSPTIGKGIALAYINCKYTSEGTLLTVQIRQNSCACQVVKTPFYKARMKVQAAA